MGRIIDWQKNGFKCEECEIRTGYPHYYRSMRALQSHIKQSHESKMVVVKKEKVVTIKAKKKKKYYVMDENIRTSVLNRDKHKCVECGSKKGLHIHHKKHRSKGGTDDLENLMTLCELCHTEQHRGEPVYNVMIQRFWEYEEIS
jgi:5-methylcytosine-specific restriction endonuclease McrA